MYAHILLIELPYPSFRLSVTFFYQIQRVRRTVVATHSYCGALWWLKPTKFFLHPMQCTGTYTVFLEKTFPEKSSLVCLERCVGAFCLVGLSSISLHCLNIWIPQTTLSRLYPCFLVFNFHALSFGIFSDRCESPDCSGISCSTLSKTPTSKIIQIVQECRIIWLKDTLCCNR